MSTGIQWTDETWNPIAAFDKATGKRGWFCVHASPGCINCYAESMNRFRGNGHAYRVTEAARVDIRIVDSVLVQPLSWRKARRVFVCSMTDLFLDQHTDEMIDRVFAVVALTQRHTFQVLTKRAERMHDYLCSPALRERIAAQANAIMRASKTTRGFDDALSHRFLWRSCDSLDAGPWANRLSGIADSQWPLSNVWLGVSVENQQYADERIPLLLQTPAAIRFLSCEPLLGPVSLSAPLRLSTNAECGVAGDGWISIPDNATGHLSWVIVGGESGRNARPFDAQWGRSIVEQCRAAGVAVFVKQLGAQPGFRLEDEEARGNMAPSYHHYDPAAGLYIKKMDDSHGGDPDEWPEELRVREFPRSLPPIPEGATR